MLLFIDFTARRAVQYVGKQSRGIWLWDNGDLNQSLVEQMRTAPPKFVEPEHA